MPADYLYSTVEPPRIALLPAISHNINNFYFRNAEEEQQNQPQPISICQSTQELQEIQKQRQYRQEKAAAKFSKERFIRATDGDGAKVQLQEP
jgi:hypothetical protein